MNSPTQIEAIAKSLGVDAGALLSFLGFMQSNMERHPELRQELIDNPDETIKIGLRVWLQKTTEFFTMLQKDTPQARALKSKLASEVHDQLRQRSQVKVD